MVPILILFCFVICWTFLIQMATRSACYKSNSAFHYCKKVERCSCATGEVIVMSLSHPKSTFTNILPLSRTVGGWLLNVFRLQFGIISAKWMKCRYNLMSLMMMLIRLWAKIVSIWLKERRIRYSVDWFAGMVSASHSGSSERESH